MTRTMAPEKMTGAFLDHAALPCNIAMLASAALQEEGATMSISRIWVALALASAVVGCSTKQRDPRAIGEIRCTQPKPVYPKDASAERVQGRVVVRMVIATSGEVESAIIEESSGDARLDGAAAAAVAKMRCTAFDFQKQRILLPATASQPITFELPQAPEKK